MTPHLNAPIDGYADIVLMPGDPIRAKYIAENFLTHVELVNDIRGCYGYTGAYHDKRVSVQASGMGQPSIGIYSYELFTRYNVQKIIRIGTCGSFQQHINVGDVILAMTSSSESTQIRDFIFSPCCDYALLYEIVNQFKFTSINHYIGAITSIDSFYHDDPEWWKKLSQLNILGVDMETYMLYYNAMRTKKSALTVNMVSDNLWGGYEMSSSERVTKVDRMVKCVLESIL